jgi:hypothetical protein
MAAGAVALNLLLAANVLWCPSVPEAGAREPYTLRDALASRRERARERAANGVPAYEEDLRQKTLFTGPARWQMGTQLVEQAVAQGAGKPRQDLADWSLTDTQAGAAVGRRLARSNPSLTVPRHISAPPPVTARVSG